MPGGTYYNTHTASGRKKKGRTLGSGGSSGYSSAASGVSSVSSGTSTAVSSGYSGSSYSAPASTPSSSSSAAAQAAAEAAAAIKTAKAVVSEFGKDKKNPKTVSGKYAKASERAQKKREKSKAKVKATTKAVRTKYDATPRKLTKTPKFGPGNAYTVWEGSNKIASKAREFAAKPSPKKSTGSRQNASTSPYAPKPRKVAKRLQKAVKKSAPAGLVPEVVPPKMRGAVAKHGQMLEPALKKAGVDMSGPEYLGKLIQFESGWNKTAENPSSAYGYGQFIDSTAEDFRERLGVETQDPSKPKQMIKGAAMHASGKYGYNPLYAGYNPGYSDTDPILSVDSGKLVPTGGKSKPIPKQLKRTARQTLGKKPTKAILKGGKVIKDKNAGEEVKGAPPYKQTKEFIVPTEARSEVAAEQGAPARTMVTGMNPALQSALVQLAKNTGIPVRINEGYRTKQRANDFPSGTASQHHQGNAADIDNNADYSAEDLAKVGLNNTAVGGEPWHFQLNDLDASATTVNTNIPIKGTNLAIKVPTPSADGTSTGGTTSFAGTTSTGAPMTPAQAQQIKAELERRKKSPSVSKRLAAIDRWLTSPVTAATPDISQELIDRILGK